MDLTVGMLKSLIGNLPDNLPVVIETKNLTFKQLTTLTEERLHKCLYTGEYERDLGDFNPPKFVTDYRMVKVLVLE